MGHGKIRHGNIVTAHFGQKGSGPEIKNVTRLSCRSDDVDMARTNQNFSIMAHLFAFEVSK